MMGTTQVPLVSLMVLLACDPAYAKAPFPVPDTRQKVCYDAVGKIACPGKGEAFAGQDAQHNGTQPSYTDNGDGTITDNITGLMWVKSPDLNGDGKITVADKLSYKDAAAKPKGFTLAGHNDWRLPTIKEMYSLMDFRGVDPSGYTRTDVSGMVPFIDRKFFDFAYGDTKAGERVIDSQMASSNLYAPGTMQTNERTMFGVNFADGRIKGYGLTLHGRPKLFFVMYVRGKPGYGVNAFADNGNGTITDATTGLMWSKADSAKPMNWQDALAWVAAKNASNHLGHNDWRLPNVKELQVLLDYSRAPDTTKSPAINPLFQSTQITNEAGQVDWPAYWSSTTHVNWTGKPGRYASYVNFGRAMGFVGRGWTNAFLGGSWTDVHGAGAQRSDPKTGSSSDYPRGEGPQGDAIRILNYVRLVRDAN